MSVPWVSPVELTPASPVDEESALAAAERSHAAELKAVRDTQRTRLPAGLRKVNAEGNALPTVADNASASLHQEVLLPSSWLTAVVPLLCPAAVWANAQQ